MLIVGDIHGDYEYVTRLCDTEDKVIQIGDFGFGFVNVPPLPDNLYFFAGNHDNVEVMSRYPGYLGRYGEAHGIFFVSGADSIDRAACALYISWWPNEELSYSEASDCLDRWKNSTCNILLSHDGPQSAMHHFGIRETSFTRLLLSELHNVRKPRLHIFGHHHRNLFTEELICLGEKSVINILS